jgi:hypothetical protein
MAAGTGMDWHRLANQARYHARAGVRLATGGRGRQAGRGETRHGHRDARRVRGAGQAECGGDAGERATSLTVEHFRVLGCLETLQHRAAAVSLELLAIALRLEGGTVRRILRDLERAGLTLPFGRG